MKVILESRYEVTFPNQSCYNRSILLRGANKSNCGASLMFLSIYAAYRSNQMAIRLKNEWKWLISKLHIVNYERRHQFIHQSIQLIFPPLFVSKISNSLNRFFFFFVKCASSMCCWCWIRQILEVGFKAGRRNILSSLKSFFQMFCEQQITKLGCKLIHCCSN